MKLLDEIRAYNGKLDYDGLTKLVQGIGIVPVMFLKNEKASLNSLPEFLYICI